MPRWRWGDSTAPLRASLDRGEIVAFPTESSYAFGVDPHSEKGVESLYELKGRPRDKAMPVVIADIDDLARLGVAIDLPILALALQRLADLWPAALTAVLPLSGRPQEQVAAAAGLGTLAVRVPAHENLRVLLREVGPLTATSANSSGDRPALSADEVEAVVARSGKPIWIVDAGTLPGGPPSTIVAFDEGGVIRVLREGRVAFGDASRAPVD